MAPIELTATVVTSLARRWECAHLPALHELLDEVGNGTALTAADRDLLTTVCGDLDAVSAVVARETGAHADVALRLGALVRATSALTDAILTQAGRHWTEESQHGSPACQP